ncbi:ATP-binding protein [Actinomadura sp. KC345]|uniref:ATP-binding protein n=1 Tax=Actinomadura sp. KC345 TaxID=2530371 RepID=UPI001044AECF|nr:ATP-binding protein [Actinomadura sp. KC345]TDC47864.1 ATP-binding protein [Actinomadura sp. KC345]
MPALALAPETPSLVLETSERAPARARHFIAERFREIGMADDFTGRLVVTELVTNAYEHVGFGHIIVRAFPDAKAGLVVIEVCDEGAVLPVVRPEDHGAIGGRGLRLVAQLVHDWGVRPLDEGGKAVWARCGR